METRNMAPQNTTHNQPVLHTPTDDTLRETIAHGTRRYAFAYYLEDVWQFDFHCVDWHWHHEVEFVFVAKGSLLCHVGETSFELPQGSGIFINSGILHRFDVNASTQIPNIVFSPSLLSPEDSLIYEEYVRPLLRSAVSWQIFEPGTDWQREILQTLEEIFALQESQIQDLASVQGTSVQDFPPAQESPVQQQKSTTELSTLQLLLKLWNLLFTHLNISEKVLDSSHSNHRQARLQLMMQYIHDHYAETVSLDDIAAAASVSKSGALQLFQSGIHTSPVSYLIHYRLMQAAKLLQTTEKPVSTIAEETGFSGAGYFCRKFKEHYQMSPKDYRRTVS